MKQIAIFGVLGAVLMAVAVVLVDSAKPVPARNGLIIGFIAPLSGARASIGEEARIAAELALGDAQQSVSIGYSPATLRFEDSQGDPAKGVAAFQKLVAEGASVVITQNSNVSLPISPLANRLHVLQLAITTTSDRFTTPRDYVFRTNGSTVEEARLMAKFLRSRVDSATKGVGIVVMRDEYPEMLHQHLVSELAAKSVPVLGDEEFLPNETDFRTTIARLRLHGATELVCLGYQIQCGLFVKQLRESGARPNLILVNTPVNNREFFTVAGAAAESVYVTYPEPNLGNIGARRFAEKTGREMNFFSSNAYDAVHLILRASRHCKEGQTAECLARELYNIGKIEGASGTKEFDENGDMQDTYTLLTAQSGRFVSPSAP